MPSVPSTCARSPRACVSGADDLGYIWSSEMGILHVDAVTRGARVPGIYDFYAGLADSFEFVERHEPAGGGYGWLVREPVGVVGAIIPWNAAIVAMSWKIAPALLAGLHRGAQVGARGAGRLATCLPRWLSRRACRPVCSTSSPPTGTCPSSSSATPASTRSASPGRRTPDDRIAEICAQRVARVNLELGGKSAALDPRRLRPRGGGGVAGGVDHRADRAGVFGADPSDRDRAPSRPVGRSPGRRVRTGSRRRSVRRRDRHGPRGDEASARQDLRAAREGRRGRRPGGCRRQPAGWSRSRVVHRTDRARHGWTTTRPSPATRSSDRC